MTPDHSLMQQWQPEFKGDARKHSALFARYRLLNTGSGWRWAPWINAQAAYLNLSHKAYVEWPFLLAVHQAAGAAQGACKMDPVYGVNPPCL